jgi:hypothetical protein
LDSSGFLSYSTYLTGSVGATALAIAVDPDGAACVAGVTSSADFPTTPGAYRTSLAGASDAFVTKLNPSATELVYSTFIGGTGQDTAAGLALDSSGAVYISGSTNSSNFPVTLGALQTVFSGGSWDAFVTKLSSDGSTLLYSTFLGGTNSDFGTRIAVDGSGSAYVVGTTRSDDFPTLTGSFQKTFGGSGANLYGDAFVTKLNAAGSGLVYSTFLGGADDELGEDVAVDSGGSAYVTGWTFSNNFPVNDPIQAVRLQQCTGSQCRTAFVAKLDQTGATLAFSTYLGGTQGSDAYAIAIDAGGGAYVAGETISTDFPTTPNAAQPTYGLLPPPSFDGSRGFLAKLIACRRDIPRLGQADPPWGPTLYDGHTDPRNTIARLGCALTSLSMLLRDSGFSQFRMNSGDPLIDQNPGSLNDFMNQHDGYVHDIYDPHLLGNVVWETTVDNVSGITNGPGGKAARFVRVGARVDPGSTQAQRDAANRALEEAVCNHGPVVVGVTLRPDSAGVYQPHHFVVVTGKQGSDFAIVDPGARNISTLGAQPYNGQYVARGYIRDPENDLSVLGIAATNVQLALTDPGGKRTGFFEGSEDFAEIPQSSYARDSIDPDDDSGELNPGLASFININQPAQGVYRLDVIGEDPRLFEVSFDVVLQNDTPQPRKKIRGIVEPGSVSSFEINLVTEPGSPTGTTIARLATFAGTIGEINYAQQLGLIADATLAQSLAGHVTSAWNAFQAGDYATSAAELNAFKTSVQASPSQIEATAQQVFLEEADSLIGQIPAPSDSTAPDIEPNLIGTLGNSGWYVSDAAVSWTVQDPESAISSTSGCETNTVTTDTAGITFTCTATSLGGTASASVTIKRDTAPPTLSFGPPSPAPNAAGWINTNVSIPFTADDNLSGVASTAPSSPLVLTAEGAAITGSVRASDVAGNTATFTSAVVKIDKTPPMITIATPPNAATYLLNAAVASNYTCADTLSGVSSCAGPVASGANFNTGTVGANNFTVTSADTASNSATATNSYSIQYNFVGFLQPVNNLPVINIANAGRTIPIKWQLTDANAAYVSDLDSFTSLVSAPIACDASPTAIIGEELLSTGGTVLRYDAAANHFIFNWQTSSTWADCRLLQLTLADGTQYFAKFKFK